MSTISPYKNRATTSLVYGSGPAYGAGGPETDTAQASYFDVTLFTDPTVRGVVLIRGQQLDGRLQMLYVGPFPAGAVVGADKIAGQRVELHAEGAVPAARPPANTDAASGWGIWKIRQGIGVGSTGCVGFQIDTAAGSEVFVTSSVLR